MEENKGARVALSFFSNITLRKAFNQWLVWAQQRQEYGTKLHLAVQVPPLSACAVTSSLFLVAVQATAHALKRAAVPQTVSARDVPQHTKPVETELCSLPAVRWMLSLCPF